MEIYRKTWSRGWCSKQRGPCSSFYPAVDPHSFSLEPLRTLLESQSLQRDHKSMTLLEIRAGKEIGVYLTCYMFLLRQLCKDRKLSSKLACIIINTTIYQEVLSYVELNLLSLLAAFAHFCNHKQSYLLFHIAASPISEDAAMEYHVQDSR